MTDAVALVTGASRGIGYHIARALGEAGTAVALVARDAFRLQELSAHLLHQGHRALALAMDVNDERGIPEVVDRVVKELGPIDLLVNAAGIIEAPRPIWDSGVGDWWQVMCTNVRGPYLYTAAVTRHMVETGRGGRVINLNSGASYSDLDGYSAYCASKAALSRLTSLTASEGAAHGIRAFDLCPGVVRTEMTEAMPMHADRTEWTTPEQVVELVQALAGGELDAWSGRMVRAGADTPASLAAAAGDLDARARQLDLVGYGAGDPVRPA